MQTEVDLGATRADGGFLSPSFVVPIRKVPAERILWERWEAMGDFRSAFLSWADDLLAGYDGAVANGTLPTSHDLTPDEPEPEYADRKPGYATLQTALAAGEGWKGGAALAREHDLARTVVYTVAERMGVTLEGPLARKNLMRVATEALVKDGVSQPRRILVELERQFPGEQLPLANTITTWKRRMTEAA